MTVKKQELCNNGHQKLVIRNKEDLRKKLLEGIQDTDSGKVCTIDEAFEEVDAILE